MHRHITYIYVPMYYIGNMFKLYNNIVTEDSFYYI